MTLEKAIIHAEAVAKSKEREAKENRNHGGWAYDDEAKKCSACAAEHRQLAEWLNELKEYKGKKISRLDDTISDVAYILDTLMAYRNIANSGDCNRCGKKKTCKYAPKPGQLVRYNCPFYKRTDDE